MNIVDLCNVPIRMQIGEKSFQVARLPIQDIMGLMEAMVRSSWMADVHEVAKSLAGKEKTDYLLEATKQVPRGEDLYSRAEAIIKTLPGLTCLLQKGLTKWNPGISEADILSLCTVENQDSIAAMVSYMIGEDAIPQAPAEKKGVDPVEPR